MRTKVIQNLEDFLNDFQYFRVPGYDAFSSLFEGGSKMVVVNTTPYEDGLMLEIQLAIKVDKVEGLIMSFYNKEIDKLSLSYWESLSQISSQIAQRNFIRNEIQFSKLLPELENALVKKGFGWLDELSGLDRLSNHFIKVIFSSHQKPSNLFKLCQRSYLLRLLIGETITEAAFYDYYEQMQFHKIPAHQLQEFLDFRNFLRTESI